MTGTTHTLLAVACLALFFYGGMGWGFFRGVYRGQFSMIERLVEMKILTIEDVEEFNRRMQKELDKDE